MDQVQGQFPAQCEEAFGQNRIAADRLIQLQRSMALSHWRGLEEEARACLPEYHQLVETIYFHPKPRQDIQHWTEEQAK